MPPLSTSDALQVRAICDELGTLHIGGVSPFDSVLPALRNLTGVEGMVMYRMREADHGWQLDLLHLDMPHALKLAHLFHCFASSAPPRFGLYDPLRPEPDQRNRVIDAMQQLPRVAIETAPVYREVAVPGGIGEHRQIRALICEGPSLLAWFGGFQIEPARERQIRLLSAMVPAVRQRLSIERRLREAPHVFAALHAALELLGAPAFVLGWKGEIHEMNSAARAVIERHGATVRVALRDTVARRPNALRFELMPLKEPGADGYLAVLRDMGEDARVLERVHLAATKWGLSKRQREVLEFVVQGAANAVVAQSLRIAERTVEFHVTALFDRAGVESRAALTAAVLAMR